MDKQSDKQALPRPSATVEEKHPGERPATQNEDESQYPTGIKFWIITAGVYATMFIVALDRTIVATAIPKITEEFHSIPDISWYGSAYLITGCATQLLWGRIFTFYDTKIVYLIAIFIFEVGSAVCGAAPNSIALIIGRAIAGVGCAGVIAGSTVIVSQIVPLRKRPVYIGFVGALFGIAAVVGPLLGGALTDHATWRWIFYINLPIGGAVFAALLLFLKVPKLIDEPATLWRQLVRLDPLGNIIFLPAAVCLLLALQWGGNAYAWDNARIIALFVLAGLLFIAFASIQMWRQEDATVPPRIMKQRSIACGSVYSVILGGNMIVFIYCLPIWFQAVKEVSATQSAINIFPMTLGMMAGVLLTGVIVQRIGYYVPSMIACVIVISVASGLITTWQVDSGSDVWIGYQAMYGIGLGFGMQQAVMASQTVLPQAEVAMGTALMFFWQSLGGAVFMCVSQTLFVNYLASHLADLPGIDVDRVVSAGATDVQDVVAEDKLAEVLEVYNAAVRQAFYVAVGLACALIVPALGMEWKSVKGKKSTAGEGNEEVHAP